MKSGQHDADALPVPRFCLDEGRQHKSPHDHIPRREYGSSVGKHEPRGRAHGLPKCRLHQIPSVRDRKGARLSRGEPRGGRFGGFTCRAEQSCRREDTITNRAQCFKLLDGLAGNLLKLSIPRSVASVAVSSITSTPLSSRRMTNTLSLMAFGTSAKAAPSGVCITGAGSSFGVEPSRK